MLQKLNERFSGLVAWFVVVLIGITFMLFGMQQYQQSHQAGRWSAKVNGRIIPQQTLDLFYQRVYHQPESSAATATDLKKQLLDTLIANQLSSQAARTLGFYVTNSQADAAIVQMPQFQQDEQFSPTYYQRALSAGQWTHREFQTEMREELLRNQQQFALAGTEFSLPHELEAHVAWDEEKRDYRYISIRPEALLSDVHASAEEIDAYYAQHHLDFVLPERIRVDYVLLSLADIKHNLHPDEQTLIDYYQANQTSYTTPEGQAQPFAAVKKALTEQWIAETAQTQYAAALETLAELSYQDPDSLQSVADQLGLPIRTSDWFTRQGDAVGLAHYPQWLTAAYSDEVLNAGHNSEPIALDNGQVVVLRLRDQQLAQEQPLAAVKSAVEARLLQVKAQRAAVRLGKALLAATTPQARDVLMQKHKLNWTTVKDSIRQGFGGNNELPSVHQLAFSMAPKAGLLTGQKNGSRYDLVELQQVKPGTLHGLNETQRLDLEKRLAAERGQQHYDAYLKQLLQQAKITRA